MTTTTTTTDDEDVKEETNEEIVDKTGEEEADEKPKRKRKRKRKKASNATDTAGAGDGDDSAKKLESVDHTVFVEGIPFDSTEQDVRQFFVSHGVEDVLQLRLPTWQDSGRLRGYGHCVFETAESRQKAIDELNGKHLGKRYLSISAAQKPRSHQETSRAPREQPTGCSRVFVKNLPYSANEEDITNVFRVCGKIIDGGVRIARNYHTKESKGFCYVDYKNPEGALGAVQKAAKPFGMVVQGRPCFVDYDEGQMKSSFKTKEGRMWSKDHPANKRPRKNF